jgi:hypothetical protein
VLLRCGCGNEQLLGSIAKYRMLRFLRSFAASAQSYLIGCWAELRCGRCFGKRRPLVTVMRLLPGQNYQHFAFNPARQTQGRKIEVSVPRRIVTAGFYGPALVSVQFTMSEVMLNPPPKPPVKPT